MINELRQVIESRLNSIKTRFNIAEISYRLASEDAMYPHIVWDYTNIVPQDQGRQDFTIDVHIWAKDQAQAFDIADAVIDLFSYANTPQEVILPTFYQSSTFPVDDPDKTIIHVVTRLEGQLYDKSKEVFSWQQ